ncbi:MAG TPA: glycosyltransferase family 9 protein [Ignavibacteriales bacterium]|nr:glycosyltransferase family 9 protein [Ignavibacteriales bacterium]HOL82162.1 glycosyltransferase family 9 protein [Ignavibacteriales bacterium]HOM65742.1 glycosyltransferase family 9 protein [Ignavibacteriales bacterium]HPD67597.1 glycosyltransferase family 9 protein [Ignavibacteriales bacterium]HPP34290.1 glycosyltransferase family 9 protein [Ignavibacteriales bacterium]
MEKQKKIAIVRTDKIGDVVLTLPLVKEIISHYPNSIVDFIVQEYTLPIVKFNQHIHKVYSIPNKLIDITKFFLNNKYDIIITVKPEFNIAFAAFLARIPVRIGTAFRLYSFLFNKKVYHHRKESKKNELEYNFELLKPLGINATPDFKNVDYGLKIPIELQKSVAEKYLSGTIFNPNYKTIIIHPGSGKSSIDLPIYKFKELTKLLTELNANIIVTGNHNEREICDTISHNNVINLSGKLNLKEFTALVSFCDILISNSTGPIHLAAALDKWTIGFYPLVKECSVTRWGPYTSKRIIFTPNNSQCPHNTLEQCKINKCMETISINDVYNSIVKIIR